MDVGSEHCIQILRSYHVNCIAPDTESSDWAQIVQFQFKTSQMHASSFMEQFPNYFDQPTAPLRIKQQQSSAGLV